MHLLPTALRVTIFSLCVQDVSGKLGSSAKLKSKSKPKGGSGVLWYCPMYSLLSLSLLAGGGNGGAHHMSGVALTSSSRLSASSSSSEDSDEETSSSGSGSSTSSSDEDSTRKR